MPIVPSYTKNNPSEPSLPSAETVLESRLRYAGPDDIDKILQLMEPFAKEGILLKKDRKKVESDLPRTVVYDQNDQILGVANLYRYEQDLFEVRGLSVLKGYQRAGIGKILIEKLLFDLKKECRGQTITVFALTMTPEFFIKIGWRPVKKEKFPRKIFDDCAYCLKKDDCFEEAVEIVLHDFV